MDELRVVLWMVCKVKEMPLKFLRQIIFNNFLLLEERKYSRTSQFLCVYVIGDPLRP